MRVLDREKQRREYQRKKAVAYGNWTFKPWKFWLSLVSNSRFFLHIRQVACDPSADGRGVRLTEAELILLWPMPFESPPDKP